VTKDIADILPATADAKRELLALVERHPELDAAFGAFLYRAYRQGFEAGIKEGQTKGRRRAKGLPEQAAKRGRPPIMSEGRLNLMVLHVEQRPEGMSIADAVRQFLKIMQLGCAKAGEPWHDPPKLQRAIEAYHRHRTN
jgi:hypothetical protein